MIPYAEEDFKDWPEADSTTPPLTLVVSTLGGHLGIYEGTPVLFLGEISNMPGHCAFVHEGKTHYGFHTENFRVIPADET